MGSSKQVVPESGRARTLRPHKAAQAVAHASTPIGTRANAVAQPPMAGAVGFAISFIRTVTVGSGFAPDLLTLQACSEERHRRRSRALADLSANKYRRWGIPPRPENAVGPEGHSGPTGGILGGRRSQHGHQGDWTGHPLRMWLGRCLTIHAPPTSVRAEPVEALCSASTGSA